MLPIGYMYKNISAKPEWLAAPAVEDVYSVSNCVSKHFANYINHWKHNGFWLFNAPGVMEKIAADEGVDLSSMTLFYYEAFNQEFDVYSKIWSSVEPEPSFLTDVGKPQLAVLEGYDVVAVGMHSQFACSPLSCYHVAENVKPNPHCLFDTFDQAKEVMEQGKFDTTAKGLLRIVTVFRVKIRA